MEQFFKDYEHTISAFSAFFTFIAVVTSLVVTALNASAHRTKIKATASIKMVVANGVSSEDRPSYMVINITNIGLMAAKIDSTCLYWKSMFRQHNLIVLNYDVGGDNLVPRKNYPVTVQPNESVSFFINTVAQFEAMLEEEYIGKGMKKFIARFLSAKIITSDGRRFNVKLDKQIKRTIREKTRMLGKNGHTI